MRETEMKKKAKKQKPRKYLSSYEIEQKEVVDRVSEYYPLDKKRKVFEIPLHYEKASDLYFDNVEFSSKPNISDDATDNMVELLKDIPEGYKAEFSITIDDYEDVTPRKVLEGINDTLALRHQRFLRESTSKLIKIGFLMFVGVSLILIKTYGDITGWWGEGTVSSDLFTYILDTFGCVLIWESVYGIFVDRSEEMDFEHAMSRKVHSIKMYDSNADQALSREDSRALVSIMHRNKKKMFSSRMLLLSGFSLLAVSVSDLLSIITMAGAYQKEGLLAFIIFMVIGVFSVFITMRVGMTAIKIFKGTYNHNIKAAVITALMLLALVVNIIELAASNDTTSGQIISTVFKIVIESSYVVGLALRFSYFLSLNKSYKKKNAK